MLDITTPVFNPFSHNYFRHPYNDMLPHHFHLFASGPVVRTAVEAWRLVLVGRFRLLDQWCEFVEVLMHLLVQIIYISLGEYFFHISTGLFTSFHSSPGIWGI